MKNKHWLTLLLLICTTIVCAVWFYLPDYIVAKNGNNVAKAAAYSELYGAASSLFASLAFVLLVYTALMQREELKLQRQELKSTREELARSAKSQEELVRLSREANEFQRHIRKGDTWPELAILRTTVSQLREANASTPLLTEIILTPKYNALRVKSTIVKNTTSVRIDQQLLDNHFLNRIIEVGKEFVVTLYHNRQHDVNNILIELQLSDIDENNIYEQRLVSDEQRFRISESKAVIQFTGATLR